MTHFTRPPRCRPMLQLLRCTTAAGLFAGIIGGLTSLLVRDRLPVIGLLIYLPLLPLGAAALLWDIIAHGVASFRSNPPELQYIHYQCNVR